MENYIEKWIEFALDNDYEPIYNEGDTVALSELIEHKEFFTQWVDAKQHVILFAEKIFIEAIARGILNKFKWDKDNDYYYNGKDREVIYFTDCECIEDITYKQAIAIRDGELESFIQKTLNLSSK